MLNILQRVTSRCIYMSRLTCNCVINKLFAKSGSNDPLTARPKGDLLSTKQASIGRIYIIPSMAASQISAVTNILHLIM